MGKPKKNTVGLHYTSSDAFSHAESAVVTFYTDMEKKKITAKLEDSNLINFKNMIIIHDLIPSKKLTGVLKAYGLLDDLCITTSVTCIEGDTFDEVEGRKRAMAKLLVRRMSCMDNLLQLVEESTKKRFFNVKSRFINKLDCVDYFSEYYEKYANKKESSSANEVRRVRETLHSLGIKYAELKLEMLKEKSKGIWEYLFAK